MTISRLHKSRQVTPEAQKPYSGKVMFRIDPAVHAQAALAAQPAGKSLNAWGDDALRVAAEKMAIV